MINLIKDKIMKKILAILSILPILAFSGINIEKITHTLSHIKGKKTLYFYNANKNIRLNNTIKLTSLNRANIVLFSNKIYESKVSIVNSYKELKSNPNSIGAIYLNKGRTQIVFIQERLASNGLVLNPKFKKHIIYEWQLNPGSLINNLK